MASTILHKVEKFLFLFLIFSIPFQTRVFLFTSPEMAGFGPEGFNEWLSGFFYFTDALVIALFILWALRLFEGSWLSFNFSHASKSPARILRSLSSSLVRPWRTPCPLGLREGSKLKISNFLKYPPLFLIAFLILSAFSIFFASHVDVAIYRWLKLVEFVGLFFYTASIVGRIGFSKISLAFIFGGVFQSVIAIAQFMGQQSLGLWFLGESLLKPNKSGVAEIVTASGRFIRAYGTFPSPNVLAAFLGLSVIFLMYWYLRLVFRGEINGKSSVFIAVSLFLLLLALALTFSRGVLVIFFATTLIFFAVLLLHRNFKKYRRQVLSLFALFLVLNALYLILLWPEIFPRVVQSRYEEAAIQERLFFNSVALEGVMQHSYGVGIGNFTTFFRASYQGLRESLYQPVHNIFLLIAAESGILAAFFFILFLGKLIGGQISSFFLQKTGGLSTIFLISAFIFLIFTGMFDHYYLTLQQGALMLWIILGMLYYNNHAIRS